MFVAVLLVVENTFYRIFSQALLVNEVFMHAGNPISRVWIQYITSSTKRSCDNDLAVYVAHNTALMIVHLWVCIL